MTSFLGDGDLSYLQKPTCCDSNGASYFMFLTVCSFILVLVVLLIFKKIRLKGWKLGVEFFFLSLCVFGGLYYYGNYYGVETVNTQIEAQPSFEIVQSITDQKQALTIELPDDVVQEASNVVDFSSVTIGEVFGDFTVFFFEPISTQDAFGEWNARVHFLSNGTLVGGIYKYNEKGDFPYADQLCLSVIDAAFLEHLPLKSDGENEVNFCLENSLEAADALGLSSGSTGTVSFMIDTYQINWAEGAYLDAAHFFKVQ